MADTKIKDLTAYTVPLTADIIPLHKTSDDTDKKVTIGNLFLNVPTNGLAIGTTQLVVAGDKVGIGKTPTTAKFELDTTTNATALAIYKDGTAYAHMVIDPAGSGVKGIGLFEGVYLSFQNSLNENLPQMTIRMFYTAEPYAAIQTFPKPPATNCILNIQPTGDIWLYPTSPFTVKVVNTSLEPYTNGTCSLGTESKIWGNSYITRLYVNATAYIDGATIGAIGFVGNMGFFGHIPAAQPTKAGHNNWANISDIASALAEIGLIDSA